jgi:hypothetical protein
MWISLPIVLLAVETNLKTNVIDAEQYLNQPTVLLAEQKLERAQKHVRGAGSISLHPPVRIAVIQMP